MLWPGTGFCVGNQVQTGVQNDQGFDGHQRFHSDLIPSVKSAADQVFFQTDLHSYGDGGLEVLPGCFGKGEKQESKAQVCRRTENRQAWFRKAHVAGEWVAYTPALVHRGRQHAVEEQPRYVLLFDIVANDSDYRTFVEMQRHLSTPQLRLELEQRRAWFEEQRERWHRRHREL